MLRRAMLHLPCLSIFIKWVALQALNPVFAHIWNNCYLVLAFQSPWCDGCCLCVLQYCNIRIPRVRTQQSCKSALIYRQAIRSSNLSSGEAFPATMLIFTQSHEVLGSRSCHKNITDSQPIFAIADVLEQRDKSNQGQTGESDPYSEPLQIAN